MAQPVLFLMLGYPGAGKTTAAKLIHELTGAVHLWADHERNQRFPSPTHSHAENLQLYALLNDETQQLLHAGNSVIFDTNFNFFRDRQKLRDIAGAAHARAVLIWVTTDKSLARVRATEQSHGQHTRIWGNMHPEVFERISSGLEEPRPSEHALTLDGSNLTREYVKKALATIAA